MSTRLGIVKTVLWALIGVLAVVTVVRLVGGLGAATNLSDAAPWGIWIAFDVMSGVALAAGGFVLAGTVYIFGLEEYRPFVRPAILTAFLGYLAVAVGLLYDLGLPWHIWHLMIYQQHHSVLFEVGMCVMLYLTVLTLEFLPVVLEHRWFDRPLFRTIHAALHKLVIPLVIAGIVLSTLHQSSLGSLFLITPYRLHPLWYSPIIWILFFISAVALGLMMVTAESLISGWLFGHKLKLDRLAGLGRAAAVVLFVYAGLRLGDMAVRGVLPQVLDGSWQASLFLFELALGALVPATLLLMRRIRTSTAGLAIAAAMVIFGMIGYRFDVCIVAFTRPEGMPYFPSWMELAVSFGIVAGAALVFIFFVEQLRVYEKPHASKSDAHARHGGALDFGPAGMRSLLPDSLDGPRRYSLAAVIGAAMAVAFLPAELLSGTNLETTPVSAARSATGWLQERDDAPGHDLLLAPVGTEMPPGAEPVELLLIDGNRDGRAVPFPHNDHITWLGEQDSCVMCHHLNMPLDKDSSCFECHRDLYVTTDIFDHAFHVARLAGNESCAECHSDKTAIKTRDTAAACAQCHQDMMPAGATIAPPAGGMRGIAPGYMDAMHGLCITCHEEMAPESPQGHGSDLAECAHCHRDVFANRLRGTGPSSVNSSER